MTRLERLAPGLPWLVGALALGVGVVRGARVGDWLATQWSFTYELEFVRRGLPGTVARLLFGEPSLREIQLLAVSISVIVGAGLLAYGLWATRGRSPSFRLGAGLVLAACPATLSQLGWDTGRFDHINHGLTLVALLLLDRGHTAAVAVLAVIATFNHEGFLLLGLPVWIGAAAYTTAQRGDSPARVVPIAVAGVAAFAWTELAGDLTALSREAWVATTAQRVGLDPERVYSSAASLFRNLDAKVTRHSGRILPNASAVGLYLAVVLAALAPYLWVALRPVVDLWRQVPASRRGLLAVAAASPLCALSMLVVGGADWSRWIGTAVVGFLVISLFLIRREPGCQTRFPLSLRWTAALVVVSLALGPLGVMAGFPKSLNVRPLPALPLAPFLDRAAPDDDGHGATVTDRGADTREAVGARVRRDPGGRPRDPA